MQWWKLEFEVFLPKEFHFPELFPSDFGNSPTQAIIYVHFLVAGIQEHIYLSFSTNTKNLVWRIRWLRIWSFAQDFVMIVLLLYQVDWFYRLDENSRSNFGHFRRLPVNPLETIFVNADFFRWAQNCHMNKTVPHNHNSHNCNRVVRKRGRRVHRRCCGGSTIKILSEYSIIRGLGSNR